MSVSDRRWGEPYEQDGWTFYAKKVAVDPTKTVVVVNGRQYFALEGDRVRRDADWERRQKIVEAIEAELKKDVDGS